MRGNVVVWAILILMTVPVVAAGRDHAEAKGRDHEAGHVDVAKTPKATHKAEPAAPATSKDPRAPPVVQPPLATVAASPEPASAGTALPAPIPAAALTVPSATTSPAFSIPATELHFEAPASAGAAPWAQSPSDGAAPTAAPTDAPSAAQEAPANILGPLADDLGGTQPTTAVVPAPDRMAVAIAIVQGLGGLPGMGIAVGLVLGVAAGILVTRFRRARPLSTADGPTPIDPTSLAGLMQRVERDPYDGEARVRLGIKLLQNGNDEVALRHLAQGFRYHPAGIIQVLKDPDLAFVRENDDVRRILKRFHRDQSHRVWTGYA